MNLRNTGMLLILGGFVMSMIYLVFGKEFNFVNLIIAFEQPEEYINSIIYSIIGISTIVLGFIFLFKSADEKEIENE